MEDMRGGGGGFLVANMLEVTLIRPFVEIRDDLFPMGRPQTSIFQ